MSIFADVNAHIKEAMKARDKDRLRALRSARAAFIEATKTDGSDHISDDQASAILKRLVKQRKESIQGFEQAGRPEQANAEQQELEVLAAFLPQTADDATTRTWVSQAISATGATGSGDIGRVMGHLMKSHRDQIDGGLANAIARELLS